MNSTEEIISKKLKDSDISHGEFTLMINEEQNYFRLKVSIRSPGNQVGGIERGRLIEHIKRISQTYRQSLKFKIKI